MKKLLPLLILLFVAFQIDANAAARTASVAGNWSNTATWGGSAVPTSSDAVTINDGIIVTVDVSNATCASISAAQSGNSASGLTFNVNSKLTVTGNVTISGKNGSHPASFNMTSGGIFQIGGTLSFTSVTFTPGIGTVEYNGAAQTVLPITYYNLTLSGTGAKTTTGITVNGILSKEGDATVSLSAAPTFGSAATLQYKGTASVTTTVNEFPNAFAGTGGLIIDQGVGNTVTLNANKTALAGNVNIKSGTLNLSTFTANRASGTLTLTIAGTLKLSGTSGGQTGSNFPTGFTTLTMTGGTVDYALATGAQTIYSTPAYNNLILENTSGSITAGGNLTVNGALTTTAGGTLDMSTFTLLGTLSSVTNGGTIKTSNTANPPIASGINWGGTGTIEYAVLAGGQSVPAGTFFNLKFDNTSATNTAVGNVVVNGTLTTLSGGILNMNTFTLTGTLATVTNGGTIKTSSTTNPAFASGVNWGSAGLVEYAVLAGGQSVPAGTFFNLKFDNTSAANTAVGNVIVNGTLTTTAGGTLDLSTYTLGGSLATITNPGIIKTSNTSVTPVPTGKTWGGTFNYAAAAGSQNVMAGTYAILTLSNTSGTNAASGNLITTTLNNISGGILNMAGFTLSGAINNTSSAIRFSGSSNGLAVATGTIEYNGTTQTVTTGTYSTLTLSGSGTKTAGGNLTATTLNNTGGGILDMIGFTLSVSGIINNSGSTIKFNGASNGVAISTGTVEYYGATQTLPAGNYNNLTITTSGTKTLAGATSVAGVLKINAGATLDANSRTITITGAGLSWNNLGTFIYGTSKVTMNGSSAQSMFGSTFYDLEINNTAGVSLTSSDVVTHQFILTNGNLKLGNFDLTVSGTISGSGSSSYIITDGTGTVIQNVGTSPVTFPIGLVASDYTPITFSNLGTAQNYYVRVIFVTPSLTTTGLYRQWVVKETYDSTTELGSVALAWTNNSMGTLGAPTTCDLVGNITGSPNSYDPIHSHLDGSSYSVSTGPIGYPLQNITTGLYITLVGNNKILPVELSSFTSTVNGRDISLNWTTKTEKNSNKFVIERTIADNNINNLKWDNVNSVNAAVLSNSPKYYSYTDKNLQAGKYQYRLKMIDNDGSFAYSKIVEAEVSLPKNFELSQNYPNPFNPSTKINYSLPNDARVTLEVYNIIGEKVAQIVNENQSAGYYVVNFGSSSFNNVTSGIYLYKFTAVDNTGKSFSSIKKMMLLK